MYMAYNLNIILQKKNSIHTDKTNAFKVSTHF